LTDFLKFLQCSGTDHFIAKLLLNVVDKKVFEFSKAMDKSLHDYYYYY